MVKLGTPGIASWQRAFFWFYVVPSAVAGGIWGAAPLPPVLLAVFIVALATGQIWTVRTQLINGLYPWLSIPSISLGIMLIGGAFALIAYAFVRTALGYPLSG